jgi:Lon protease-like protein
MRIPLFPLHTVLAPGVVLPLHVFEDRYRALVRHCLDTSSPFGVVLILEGSEVVTPGSKSQEIAIAAVGTLAEIREASRYSDGRWDLRTVGGRRFVVHEVTTDEAPYLVADVDLLEDEVGDASAADLLVGRVTRRFVEYLRLLQPRDGEELDPIDVQVEVDVSVDDDDDDEADGGGAADDDAGDADDDGAGIDDADAVVSTLRIPEDPSALSFLLAGIVQVEPDRKQALLEAETAEARLLALDALLDRELLLLSLRLAPFTPDRSEATLVN